MSKLTSEFAIEARHLTKSFGSFTAVKDVSFSIKHGEIFGFLGPNGAGKSTTTRMLTGFTKPSSGEIFLAGISLKKNPTLARSATGIVPEEANAYTDLTVEQNISLMGELHSQTKIEIQERTIALTKTFELTDKLKTKGIDLSKGLRQRLMICMALIGNPKVLFLDEPTSGLDVASSRIIRKELKKLNQETGMTIFITTHNMSEAEQLCNRVAIINHGKLLAIETPDVLKRKSISLRSVEVSFENELVDFKSLFIENELQVQKITGGYKILTSEPGKLAQEIAVKSSHKGIQIKEINTVIPSLEDVFVSLTGGSNGI